jgi:hypothetical protein
LSLGVAPVGGAWLLGQAFLLEIGEGVLVESAGDGTGVEQLQKVDPTLAAGTCKPGKPLVADLRDRAVVALMTCSGIIDRDVATDLPCAQQPLLLLGEKRIVGAAE